jgi:F-type H+-transporting ATPase subunit alpha
LDFVGRQHQGIYDAIVQTGKLGDDVVEQLKTAVADFTQQFQTSDGTPLVKDTAAYPMDKGAEGQEKITRRKPAPSDTH